MLDAVIKLLCFHLGYHISMQSTEYLLSVLIIKSMCFTCSVSSNGVRIPNSSSLMLVLFPGVIILVLTRFYKWPLTKTIPEPAALLVIQLPSVYAITLD